MQFYFFTEMPYPHVADEEIERHGSMRVVLPNRLLDPETTRRLYDEYLAQHEFADGMGLNVMLNEHHQTATCMDSAIGVAAGAVVQRTRGARILLLGYPLPHRESPVQIAEEVAMMDNFSGGRIDCGFVRGVGLEIHPANTNPIHNRERFYESFEVIRRAWTAGEPFSWEGKHFHFRYVNPFPQPYQKPHPPLWTTGGSDPANIAWAARNGFIYATLLAGFEGAARVYDSYREACRDNELAEPAADRFANLFLMFVGEDDEDGERGGREMMWYLNTTDGPMFRVPPGWANMAMRKGLYRGGSGARGYRQMSFEELSEAGLMICGGPDHVVRRLEHFYDRCGATNVLMMMQAGPMAHERVLGNIRRFAEQVMPRVRHLGEDNVAAE